MKKLIAIFMICVLTALSACGKPSPTPPPKSEESGDAGEGNNADNTDIVEGITAADYKSTMKANGYTVKNMEKDDEIEPYTNKYNRSNSFYAYTPDVTDLSYYFNYKNQNLATDVYEQARQSDTMTDGVRMDELESYDYSVYTCMYDDDDWCIVSLLSGNSIIIVSGPISNAESYAEIMEYFGVPETPLISSDGEYNFDDSGFDFGDDDEGVESNNVEIDWRDDSNVIQNGDSDWISPDFENKGDLNKFLGTEYVSSFVDTVVLHLSGSTGGFVGYPTPEIAWNCMTLMNTFEWIDEDDIIDFNQEDMSFTVTADAIEGLMSTYFNISPENLPPIPGNCEVMYLEESDAYAIYGRMSGGAYDVGVTNYRVEGNRCILSLTKYGGGGDDFEEGGYVVVLEKNPNSEVGYSIVQFQCP